MLPPSKLNANMYRGISLPWDDPTTAPLFDKTTFIHKTWDEDGILTNGSDFFSGSRKFTLAAFRDQSVTMNSVTRWREAHLELAETERDVIWELVEKLRDGLGRGKEEDLGDIWMEAGMSTVVVLVKRTGGGGI